MRQHCDTQHYNYMDSVVYIHITNGNTTTYIVGKEPDASATNTFVPTTPQDQ